MRIAERNPTEDFTRAESKQAHESLTKGKYKAKSYAKIHGKGWSYGNQITEWESYYIQVILVREQKML